MKTLAIVRKQNVIGCTEGHNTSYMQFCGSGSSRIRAFLVGSRRLGPDPDPDLNKWPNMNFLVCVKAIHT
jgi:hypothetical protein